MHKHVTLALLPLAFLACATSAPEPPPNAGAAPPAMSDASYEEQAVAGMHDALLNDIEVLAAATREIQAAAPASADRGWNAKDDAAAVTAMRGAWVRARTAYEHVEGALAPLFPSLDVSIDARYDDFLTQLAAQGGDSDLFDGTGVTGMHAVERILYSDVTPQRVIDFESSMPGYVKAAFPATAGQAAEFKSQLCGKLVADADELLAQWTPVNIDVAVAFQGLISLMNEQREKVQKAASNEEESRYSQRTMADLRDNLQGARTVYALFQPWIVAKTNHADPTADGPTIDARIIERLQVLDRAYRAVSGASIPAPPVTWSAESPSASDLKTPFGELYTAVRSAVDPATEGSIVSELNHAATVLGFPTFQVGK